MNIRTTRTLAGALLACALGAAPALADVGLACGPGGGSPFGGAGVAAPGAVLSAFLGTLPGGVSSGLPSLLGQGGVVPVPASCLPAENASLPVAAPRRAAGNPVDVVTGHKHERAIDLHFPAASPGLADALDFVFARHYDSGSADASVLGPGWRHSFETRVAVSAGRRGAQVRVLQADGRAVAFSGAHRLRDGGVRRNAAQRDDGVLDETTLERAPGWVWRWRSGRQLVFDGAGRLRRIVAADLDAIALRHDAVGRLASVTDNRGHRVDFEYHGLAAAGALAPGAHPGRLAALVMPTGRRVEYRYDRDGRLVEVAHGDGARIGYRYEDARAAHRLTAIAGPDGRRSEYRYDADGRIEYSRAAGDDDASALRFAYHVDDKSGRTGRTTISQGASARERAVYRWRTDPFSGPRLESSDGDGCASCPPVGARYRYGAAGELAAIAGRTLLVEVDRDARGRPVAILSRAVDPGAGPVTITGGLGRDGTRRRAREGAGEGAVAGEHAGAGAGKGTRGGTREGAPERTRKVAREVAREGTREGASRRAAASRVELRWADHPVFDLPARVRTPSVVDGRWHEWRLRWDDAGRPVELGESGHAPVLPVATVAAAPMSADTSAATAPGARGRSAPATVPGAAPASRTLERRVRFAYVLDGPARGKLARIDGPLDGAAGRIELRYDAQRRLRGAEPAGARGPREPDALADAATVRETVRRSGVAEVEDDAGRGRLVAVAADGARWVFRFDDFGRTVAIDVPGSGRILREHDAADRLVVERLGALATARYRYDAEGRLVEHALGADDQPPVLTRYAWSGAGLVAIDHPEQSERYAYDARGRLSERVVVLHARDGAPVEHRTRYLYGAGDSRTLERWSLPDGSWLVPERNAAGRVVGLARDAGGEVRPLVSELRTRAGLWTHARFGNGVREDLRFGRDGDALTLARAVSPPRGTVSLHAERLWLDASGNPLRKVGGGFEDRYAYDSAERLVQAVRSGAASSSEWRYRYDAGGNRVLAQQPEADAAPWMSATLRTRYAPADPRPLATRAAASGERTLLHDAAGRTLDDGARRYRWSADDRLLEVLPREGPPVRHRYNHRGERVATEVGGRVTRYLYDDHALLAELDDAGRVLRQYVRLADRPIALVDAPAPPGADVARARVTYLHLNHLGAPDLATAADGHVSWRAEYAPFGRARASGEFELALRLPGQVEDAATGLHDNLLRWYDPLAGRYLSPDPLPLRGGPHPFAYAGGNPLRRIDPTGALLFAFDGTGNSDPPPRRDDWSNVFKLARTYADGRVWYMSGVGTDDAASGIGGGSVDAIDAASARSRVDWMLGELERAVTRPSGPPRVVDVDIIGFSRGAAMARDFSNRVADRVRNGRYTALGACVHLRFLGLWDTVAQFGLNGLGNIAWRLSVPAEVGYAAQAVALNEHRTLFPGESIAGAAAGGVRIERGFVGAHADVGGSYAEGDLSDVALAWMVGQARSAGVPMFALTPEFARVSAPLLHDSNTDGAGDREFLYRNSIGWIYAAPVQRMARVDGLQWRDTGRFIQRFAAPQPDAYGQPTLAGLVDMAAYGQWLAQNYALTLTGP